MLAIKTDRRTNYWSFHSSCWDLSKADTNSISVHPSYWNLPFSLNKADGQTTLHFIPHFRIHLRQMDRLHITSTFIIGSTSAGWKNYASFHPQIGIYARQTRYVQFTMYFRYRRHRVDIGTLSYLVYIVVIAMLTISYRHRVDIGTLSYLVYIVDIAMLTISYRHRVDIGTCQTSFTSFTSSTSRWWRYRIDIVSTSVPCHPLSVIPRSLRSHRRHRDVDDIVLISCIHRYLVIPRLHR